MGIEQQLDSLSESIKKWEGIVAGTEKDYGTKNCQCCIDYFNREAAAVIDSCIGCPIHEKTGKSLCNGTPYTDWIMLMSNDLFDQLLSAGIRANTEEQKLAAKKNYIFYMIYKNN